MFSRPNNYSTNPFYQYDKKLTYAENISAFFFSNDFIFSCFNIDFYSLLFARCFFYFVL
jgi:hypothetical protein